MLEKLKHKIVKWSPTYNKEKNNIYRRQVLDLIEEVEQSYDTQWRYSGCDRCGAMSPLKKRKGKYQFVCDKCKKELNKR